MGERARTRVLVVSHEARLTGAPRVAVDILRSLRRDGHDVVCVLRAGGPLRDELAAAADRLVTEPLPRLRALLRRARLLRPVVDRVDELVAWAVLARRRPALAYLNTVKAACYVRPALRLGVPVVLHVHETGALAETTLRRYPVGPRWREVNLVACSTATRDHLAPLVGVAPEHIEVVHSPVDTRAVAERAGTGPGGPPTAPGAVTVGACGTVNERKGTDLWLEMAHAVRERRPGAAVAFRWVGRRRGRWPDGLAARLGLDEAVEFTGETAAPHPLLAGMDVFTLPSRDDPFPLVVLEAMALGRPVVAFDVGGVREQLGDAGLVVPAGNPGAMADAVVSLLDDPDERARLGAAAARRVRTLWGIDGFRQALRRTVDAALGVTGAGAGTGSRVAA